MTFIFQEIGRGPNFGADYVSEKLLWNAILSKPGCEFPSSKIYGILLGQQSNNPSPRPVVADLAFLEG